MPERKGYSTAFDPLVVRTADLKAALDRYVKDFKSRHDGKTHILKKTYGSHGGHRIGERGWADDYDTDTQQGATTWIAEQAGLSQRRIWGIMNNQTKHTSLDIADKIIQALEMTYVYHNGEVPVVPNPQWNQERWVRWMNRRGCSADEE